MMFQETNMCCIVYLFIHVKNDFNFSFYVSSLCLLITGTDFKQPGKTGAKTMYDAISQRELFPEYF